MQDLLVSSYVQQVPPLTGVSMATMGVSSLSIERYVWNVLCPFNDIHDNNIGIQQQTFLALKQHLLLKLRYA